jgi:multidrug efflux pump subunit AcrA (membrane-fusion protein)
MTATLMLSDAASAPVARLPLSAVFNQGDGASLFVADTKSGAITRKRVTVKAYESDDVLVEGGVDEGADIVVAGVQKLDPGQKVRVVSSLSF